MGRATQIDEVAALFTDTRLVTLTGPPGIGKTRLGLEVARRLAGSYGDGAWLVELAAVTESGSVAAAVASALGVDEQPPRPVEQTLARWARGRNLLVVFDNCEHLIGPCALAAAALLEASAGIAILATSQEALRVGGEAVWPVPGLSLPADPPSADLEGLVEMASTFEAIRLFCDRAAATSSSFALSSENLPAVAEICRRLDGLPLAIELAVAHVNMFSPAEISTRLDDRFRLLTKGSRAVLPRHQTLRAAVDWSYQLLTEAERVLMRRLAVFVGSFTLEAAEEVCSDEAVPAEQVSELLSHLVSRSLVVMELSGARSRYRLLETLHNYGADRLAESGEAGVFLARRARWAVTLVERLEPEIVGSHQREAIHLLAADYDNVRAVLAWAVREGEDEMVLHLVGSLVLFWHARRDYTEAWRWLDLACTVQEGPPAARAKALWGAGLMARWVGDLDTARPALERSLTLWRQAENLSGTARCIHELGLLSLTAHLPALARPYLEESVALARTAADTWCLARALVGLASSVAMTGSPEEAGAILGEAVSVARSSGDGRVLATALASLGQLALATGKFEEAGDLLREALDLALEVDDRHEAARARITLGSVFVSRGDRSEGEELLRGGLDAGRELASPFLMTDALLRLGTTALATGDLPAARASLEECRAVTDATGRTWAPALIALGELAHAEGDVAAARQLLGEGRDLAGRHGNVLQQAWSSFALGEVARAEGRPGEAADLHHEALTLRWACANRPGVADSLEAVAGLAATAGRDDEACRVFAAAQVLRDVGGHERAPARQFSYDQQVAVVRQRLAQQADAAWAEGAGLGLEQAVAYASRRRGPRGRARVGSDSLTRTEREVAALVAEGLTNREVGERLFISPRTVQAHVSRIMSKLEARSRVEVATMWSAEERAEKP
ncbi:MAG TPA: tetratricopeptide repeat protein [Acidimicrobiales bacterium]|nr:tetratricopeptide repeat protein [Acidimicrobiales bacterium]